MKFQKRAILFSLAAVILCLGCVSTDIGVSQPKAETDIENVAAYLPLITKNWPSLPSYGVAINDFSFLPEAEASGSYWVHFGVLKWSDIEPNYSGENNWDNVESYETSLIVASNAGLKVILPIVSTPIWAQKYSGVACGPMGQDNLDDFAAFMARVVERYSQPPYNVKYYEIWNEPDSFLDRNNPDKLWGCWGDDNLPYYGGEYYAEMLKVVYPAIKQANPEAQLVLGGLLLDCDPRHPGQPGYCKDIYSAKPLKFIEGILKNTGGHYFDYLNFHGYNYYSPDSTAIESERNIDGKFQHWEANGGQIEGKLDYLIQLQATYGIDKPVFVTEAGILFDGTPTVEFQEEKANYVVYLYTRNKALGITGTTWYLLESPGWRNSGLLQDPDRAFVAYKFMTDKLNGNQFKNQLNLGAGIVGFEFENIHKLWVLFSLDGTTQSISVPAGFYAAQDLYGNPVIPANGKITFSRPVYIEFSN